MYTSNTNARRHVQALRPFLGAKNDNAKSVRLETAGRYFFPTDDLRSKHYHSLQGRDFNDWYVVLSYGYWPLWAYHRPTSCWFGNADTYSRTTSEHASQTHPRGTPTMLPCEELKALIMGLPMLP